MKQGLLFRRFFANLFGSRGASRQDDLRHEPPERRTSEDWRQEFELEKERRRGMRGDAGF